MRPEPAPLVNVLPGEENEILLEDRVDCCGGEFLADSAAVFVIDHAGRLVENFPAALPGLVAEIGVFEVKRAEELVEAAELQKFSAIEGAGSAAAVEAREQSGDCGIDSVADAQAAVFPPALRESGFFALLVGIAEKNLAGNGEDFFVGEAGEQWGEEAGFDAHVAIEEDDDVGAGRAEALVRTAAEAQIAIQREKSDAGKILAQEIRAAVFGTVVDHQDFVVAVAGERSLDGRQVFREQIAAVPVRNHYCCAVERWTRVRYSAPGQECGYKIGGRDHCDR